jgi:hypothetical protein
MAFTEGPPIGDDATSDAQVIVEQGRREPTQGAPGTPSRQPRWRTHRTRELLRLAQEADMFVWEKIRLRDLREDLEAETARRHVHEALAEPQDASDCVQDAVELDDFERDPWPH